MTEIAIGIDPGTNTGFAVWNITEQRFDEIKCLKIHKAIEEIAFMADLCKLHVTFEDARKRKWFGNAGREQLQGAGSIKRDCSIWEDFLTDAKIPFMMVAPMNIKTKLKADAFKRITGWQGQTNEHSRDAAMMVFGLKSVKNYDDLF